MYVLTLWRLLLMMLLGIVSELDLLLLLYNKNVKNGRVQELTIELSGYYKIQKTFVDLILAWMQSPHKKQPLHENDSKFYIWEDMSILEELSEHGISELTFPEYRLAHLKATELERTANEKKNADTPIGILSRGSASAMEGKAAVLLVRTETVAGT